MGRILRYGRTAPSGVRCGNPTGGVTQMALKLKSTTTVTGGLTADYDAVPSHVSSCPECESSVLDGQGVLGSVDCDWNGFVA